jgi:hypothetical protein
LAVIFNAKGTTSPYFLLGKGGTTLYQGSSDPTGSYTASAGDVWFDTNANTLKFRNAGNSAWEQGSLAGGDLDVTGDATITGNLTVNGTTTIVNTTNTSIQDPLLLLSRSTTGTPSQDSGFIIERGDSTNVGMIWDESEDEFALVTTTEDGTTSGDISIASYADLQVGGFTSSTVDLNGGAIDGTVIGGSSAAVGTFSTLIAGLLGGALDAGNQNITNIDVDSGAIDGTVIGAASAAAITGTTITGTSLVGTLATAAQTNITSVGTLGSVAVTGTATVGGIVGTSATGSLAIPVGTTAQRPGSPATGSIRFNSTVSRFEGYDGSAWLYIDIPADLGDT